MPEETKVLDFEAIKTKTSFEDTDLSIIKAQADKEFEAEKKPKDDEGKSGEEAAPAKDTSKKSEEPTEDEKKEKEAKEQEEAKQEDDRILGAKDEDLKAEEKTRKAELLKAKDESDKKAQVEEVAAIAKEHGLSEEEAKESIEHFAKIREKYKDDPKAMAKAYYFIQRQASKHEAELKKAQEVLREAPVELNMENVIKDIDKGKFKTGDGKVFTRDMVVEAYRKENAEICELLDDETVLKMAAKDASKHFVVEREKRMTEISSKAKDKRAALYNSLSDTDKAFLPEIKPLIDKLPDVHILSEAFSIEDTLRWAKGKTYDQAIKDAEERGFKRGQSEAKILGEKRPGEGKTPASKKGSRTLTEAEKKRALDKYDGQPISDEEKYKLHLQELEEYDREHKHKKE